MCSSWRVLNSNNLQFYQISQAARYGRKLPVDEIWVKSGPGSLLTGLTLVFRTVSNH